MKIYEEAQAKRAKAFKDRFPILREGVEYHDVSLEVQGLELWTLTNGMTIHFYEEPGHGWFFDLTGELIGEEDDGLYTGGRDLLNNASKKTII